MGTNADLSDFSGGLDVWETDFWSTRMVDQESMFNRVASNFVYDLLGSAVVINDIRYRPSIVKKRFGLLYARHKGRPDGCVVTADRTRRHFFLRH